MGGLHSTCAAAAFDGDRIVSWSDSEHPIVKVSAVVDRGSVPLESRPAIGMGSGRLI